MDFLRHTRETLVRRRAVPWNWAVQYLGVLLLALALLFKSHLLAASGIIFLGVSCLDLPLPEMRTPWVRWVHRAQSTEYDWLHAPWTRAKRLQAGLLALGLILAVAGLWLANLPLLMLLAVALVLWRVWLSNRALGVGRYEEEAAEEAEPEEDQW